MTTKAIKAWGTLLQIGDGEDVEGFTTIAEVKDISAPELTLDTEDVTSHDSPGGYEEHIGTILRTGNVSFAVNYVPTEATHDAETGLLADMAARVVRNFQLIWSDTGGTVWSFAALVTAVGPSAPVGGSLQAAITLKLTGQPTLA